MTITGEGVRGTRDGEPLAEGLAHYEGPTTCLPVVREGPVDPDMRVPPACSCKGLPAFY